MNTAEAADMARDEMDAHGLHDWRFDWLTSGRIFGRCIYATKTIELSIPLVTLNSRDEVLQTILHEIAHAHAGRHVQAHGAEWRAAARRIGARPVACYGHEVTRPARRKLVDLDDWK